jgi:SAM-dependent methyltransferase
MNSDVVDLREFYESLLGQLVRRLVLRQLQQLWPDVTGQRILGLGYATPYLQPLRGSAERVLAAMPASQGVMNWPDDGPGLTLLTDECELPLPDMSMDRVLLVHGLEYAERLKPMMREIWRVLGGGGRLIIIVPNRRSIWARTDGTPFGHGSPYTSSQLRRLLRNSLFIPEREHSALFVPPFRSRFMLAGATAWESIGRRWFSAFSGLHIVEASKQIYASAGRERSRQRRPLLATDDSPVLNRTPDR